MRPSTHVVALIAAVVLLQHAAIVRAQGTPAPGTVPPGVGDLFDARQLQTIRLVINPRDWAALKADFLSNTYYPAHLVWRDQMVKNVGIRSRGTGSRSGTKPGLRVDFNLYDGAQHFHGLKSVVLRNNVQDPSHLHERLGMQLFTALGLAAPREAHARLYVNDEYAGLYSLVESIDKVFLADRYQQDDGYLYEYDYDADDHPYYFEYKGTDPSLYSPKPFKPVTHEIDPDPRPIAELIRAVAETSAADFNRVVGRHLDLDTFVTQAAVETFLADIDGLLGDWGMNNFYLYRFEGTSRATLIPWDKSEAFKGGVARGIWQNIDDVPRPQQNRLMTRAMENPALRALYLDVLLRCADIVSARAPAGTEASGWLEREIRFAYEQVRVAALEDTATPFSNDAFEEDVRRLITFARERSDVVREAVRQSQR